MHLKEGLEFKGNRVTLKVIKCFRNVWDFSANAENELNLFARNYRRLHFL